MKFSLLVPTRGRPGGLRRVVDSALDLAEGEVEVLVGYDVDDKEYEEVAGTRAYYYGGLGSSQKVCDLAERCDGDAMRIASNDEEFVTPGWDRILFERWAEDPLWCLYTNDREGENTGGRAPCVTREWYEVAGYYPFHFWHWHADTWVTSIAESVGRLRLVPEVSVVHRHFKKRLGGAKYDEVYRRRGPQQHDLWRRTEGERHDLEERLREAIDARDSAQVGHEA